MASFPFISSITKRGRAGRTGMIEWKGALNGKPNAKLHGLLTLVLLFLGLYCFMSNHFTLLIANQLFFGKLLRKSDMQTENGVVTARQTRLESFRFFFCEGRTTNKVQDDFSNLIKCSLKWIIRSHSFYDFSALVLFESNRMNSYELTEWTETIINFHLRLNGTESY